MSDITWKREIFKRLINRISKFDIISKDINKTGIPDDVVLIVLNSLGFPCFKIDEFSEITCIEIDDKDIYGINFILKYPNYISDISIEWSYIYDKNEFNNKVIQDIKSSLENKICKFNYSCNKKELYDQLIKMYSKDPTITSEINKTDVPDDVLLSILSLKNININSINELKSVEYEIKDTDNVYGYIFKFVFNEQANTHFNICEIKYNLSKEE